MRYFLIAALGLFIEMNGLAGAQAGPTAAISACDSTSPGSGYFEGTATSKAAGVLKVSLNLSCVQGQFSGDFLTPVGNFQVFSGSLDGDRFRLIFGAGSDKGTLDARLANDSLTGHFVFGEDSGAVSLLRVGNAKVAGFVEPTLDITPAQWREDFCYFATEVPKTHANAYYRMSAAQFDSAVSAADRQLENADGDHAYVAIDRIANAIGDGHTYVQWPDEDLAMVPVTIRFFDGEYRVASVAPGNERALGTRVIKINGISIASVINRLRPLTPTAETRSLGDIRIEDFLTIGMLLHGVDVIPDRTTITYTLRDDSGTESTLTLHGTSMHDAMSAGQITVLRVRPLYLQNRDSGLWCENRAVAQTLYCSSRNYDNLPANAARLLAQVSQLHPKKLVIDMRFNLGGDYMLGEKALIQPLSKLPELNKRGHLFVLISPYTFSAGMSG